MARTSGPTARIQRLIALGATSLLAAATAVAFGRLFAGPGVTLKLLGAAAISGGVAVLLERRTLLLSTAISLVLMLAFAAVTVFPDSTWLGLPTWDTLSKIGAAATQVGEQARVQVAPTAPLQPLLLAGITATWAAMFSAHALAFRAGSPLLALLPPAALLAFTDTILDRQDRPMFGLLFLLGALAMIFADGLRRLQGWGPIWGARGTERGLVRDAGRGARRVTTTAVVIAAMSPFLVPGFGASGIVDLAALNRDERIALSPLVDIASQLKRSEPFELFRVVSQRPTYHRMLALVEFNGSTWTPPTESAASPVDPGDLLLPSHVPDGERLVQTYRITKGTRYPWLPMAYPPASIEIDRGIDLDRSTTTVWVDDYLDAGDTFTVSSVGTTPTPEQLDQVSFPTPAPTDPAVRLPDGLSPGVGALAARWMRGSDSTYRKILAVQDHLRDRSRFTYSTDVPARGDSFTIADFLTTTRTGFCQQFASAMAVLLRTQGIPTRVALGFTQGTPVPGEPDTYRVTTDNYHVWVEVRFPFYGWLAFEPTPTRQNPVALPYLAPGAPCVGAGCPTAGPSEPGGGEQGGLSGVGRPDEVARRQGGLGPRGPVGPGSAPPPSSFTPRIWVAIAAGALLALWAVTPLIRWARRRRRVRRAGPGARQLVLANYDLFTERAGDLGWARAPWETPAEYGRKVRASGLLADGELDRLTAVTVAAAYGEVEPDDDDVTMIRESAMTVLHELRSGTSTVQRFRGLYRKID